MKGLLESPIKSLEYEHNADGGGFDAGIEYKASTALWC